MLGIEKDVDGIDEAVRLESELYVDDGVSMPDDLEETDA